MISEQPASPSYAPLPLEDVGQGTNVPFVFGVLVMALVLSTWGLLALLQSTRTSQAVEAQARSRQLDGQLKEASVQATLGKYAAIKTVSKHMTTLLRDRYVFTPTWQAIKSSVPADVQFTSVMMTQDYRFRITGTAKSVAALAAFSKSLASKPGILDVSPASMEKSGESYRFSVTFSVAPSVSSGASNE